VLIEDIVNPGQGTLACNRIALFDESVNDVLRKSVTLYQYQSLCLSRTLDRKSNKPSEQDETKARKTSLRAARMSAVPVYESSNHFQG